MEILYAKYSILIEKKIREFHFYKDFEDIFQESLFVLYKATLKYDDTTYPFFFYFYAALVNRLKSIRREMRGKKIEVDDIIYELKDKGNSYSLDFYNDELFKGLNDEEKTYIHLFYMKKWSVKAIGDEYKINTMKVYYILKIAKNKILKNAKELEYI